MQRRPEIWRSLNCSAAVGATRRCSSNVWGPLRRLMFSAWPIPTCATFVSSYLVIPIASMSVCLLARQAVKTRGRRQTADGRRQGQSGSEQWAVSSEQ